MSPDDIPMMSYLLLVGKFEHVTGHLSIGICSEQNAVVNALIIPQLKGGEMAAPGACCNIYAMYETCTFKTHRHMDTDTQTQKNTHR